MAVKIITHSSADDDKIARELALSLSFDHPNLVRALHFAKLRINPGSGHTSLVSALHPAAWTYLALLIFVSSKLGRFGYPASYTSFAEKYASPAWIICLPLVWVLVRALHFAKLRINPGSGHTSLVSALDPAA